MYKIFLAFCFIWVFIASCSNRSINLDITRQTSDLLHCDKIFGKSISALEKENAIILQTGTIDTTDEQLPIKSAIVIINDNEIILSLVKKFILKNEITEYYSGHTYILTLTYTEETNQYGNPFYKGHLIIINGNKKSECNVEGRKNNL